ncbi:MAG: hypothetical protein QXP80_01715 [Zestosphaera sp.]
MGLGLSRRNELGDLVKVVMGVFESHYIGYVMPQNCLSKSLEGMPEEVLKSLGAPKIVKEVFIDSTCVPITGLVIRGGTPTGERGDYVEVFKGFLPPLPNSTPAQCFLGGEGVFGCRYLLQEVFVDQLCKEREMTEQLTPQELTELVKEVLKATNSEGLWLYMIECGGDVTALKILDRTDL